MFAESLQKAQEQIRDLEKETGRLEDDLARVQGLLRAEKSARADAEKGRDALAKKYEALQSRFASASAQGRSSASRVNGLLLEQGELEGLREQFAALKAELAEASGDLFALKAEALAATRLHAAEVARANRFESEREEAVAATERAEQAAREALNRLRESEQIQAELAEKLAISDRMNEAFMSSMTRGD